MMFHTIKYDIAVILCNTKEETYNTYNQVKGHDGLPNDPALEDCYPMLINSQGEMLTENT